MDRELSQEIIRKENMKKYSKIIGGILLIVLSLLVFRNLLFPKIKKSTIQTAIAEKGNIEGAITASGIVIPEFEQIITSPIQSKIEKLYFYAGEKVIIDSSILKLDTESAEADLRKLDDELQLKRNKLTKLSIEMDERLVDLQTSFEIQKLQMKALSNNVDIKKQLLEIGVCTTPDLEQAELNFEIGTCQLNQLEQQIKNEKKSQEIDISDLQLQIRIQQTEINTLKRKLEQAKIRPSTSGVLAWVNDNIGANINQGDQIAKIADLSSFKIKAKISDMHVEKLMIGNPVRIRINSIDLLGNISAIQPTIENGVMTFSVELEEKTSSLLRSNMRVDVFVITSFKENVVRVKNGAFINGSGSQDIFVIENGVAIRRSVIVGSTNFDWIEVREGLRAGETAIISDMEEHIHKDRIKVVE